MSRSSAIDLVRIVGLIAIVAGHSFTQKTILLATYTWHVPVFFILTGYLWPTRRTVNEEIRKRSSSLLKPYISWLLIIAIPIYTYYAVAEESFPWKSLAGTVLGGAYAVGPFGAYWFVTALLLSACVVRLLNGFSQIWAWIFALTGTTLIYVFGDKLPALPYALGIVPVASLFILVGILLKQHYARIKENLWLALSALSLSIIVILLGWSRPIDMKNGELGTPVISLLAACVIGISILIASDFITSRIPDRLHLWIVRLASVGLVVVLTHTAILAVIKPHVSGLVAFLVALVLSWMVGLIVDRTSARSWLVGR